MEQKKITSLIRELEEILRPAYHNASLCEQYAWWTLCAITGKEKITLMTQGVIELTPAQHTTLADWLDKMTTQNMPIQYLLGSVPFNDLDILVQPPTLIPRPETEEWAINLIDQLKKLNNQALTILDMCAGSGCIALALAKAFPQSQVYATDISTQALALAQKNAKHNNITNVTFTQSDLFNELATDKLFDVIVSNPPYISFDEFQEMDDSVTTWEDPQALVADDNGRAIIDAIIEQAPDYLNTNKEMEEKNIPQLVLEIGYTQAHEVSDFMKECGFTNVKITKDLEGKERVVSGRVGNVITPFMEE